MAKDALRAMHFARLSVKFDQERIGCPPSSEILFAELQRRSTDADVALLRLDSRDSEELLAVSLNEVMLLYSDRMACLVAQRKKLLDSLSGH